MIKSNWWEINPRRRRGDGNVLGIMPNKIAQSMVDDLLSGKYVVHDFYGGDLDIKYGGDKLAISLWKEIYDFSKENKRDPRWQTVYGICLSLSKGMGDIKRDKKIANGILARIEFGEAIARDFFPAHYWLGQYYYETSEYDMAIDNYKDASFKVGYPMAQYKLGYIKFKHGDADQVFKFRHNKDRNSKLQTKIGELRPAGEYFRMAAEKGCVPAMHMYAVCLKNGNCGIESNIKEANIWGKKLMKTKQELKTHGQPLLIKERYTFDNKHIPDPDAQKLAEDIRTCKDDYYTLRGANSKKFKDLFDEVYNFAVHHSNIPGWEYVLNYYNLYNSRRSDEDAIEYFNKEAANDSSPAQYVLGRCYSEGIGTFSRNDKKAFDYIEKAAKQNLPLALYELAKLYEYGWGTPKNKGMAITYYTMASDGGLIYAGTEQKRLQNEVNNNVNERGARHGGRKSAKRVRVCGARKRKVTCRKRES